MELPNGKVWLKDEKINLPTDSTFSIAIGFMSLRGMGSSTRQVMVPATPPATGEVMAEQIATNMYGQVSIDIMGRTFDVVNRKEEIIQAMNSTICKETQIAKGFMIASVPSSMNDISGLDGAAIPYRFQTVFAVQFVKVKTKMNIDYYDKFRMEDLYEST